MQTAAGVELLLVITGIYTITQSEQLTRLCDQKLKWLEANNPDEIVTVIIGRPAHLNGDKTPTEH